jgi:hypothetical protein
MWKKQKVARAAEASGSLFCSSHIHYVIGYCVFKTAQQRQILRYVFLYNEKKTPGLIKWVNSLLFIHPFLKGIWKFERDEILQMYHAYI